MPTSGVGAGPWRLPGPAATMDASGTHSRGRQLQRSQGMAELTILLTAYIAGCVAVALRRGRARGRNPNTLLRGLGWGVFLLPAALTGFGLFQGNHLPTLAALLLAGIAVVFAPDLAAKAMPLTLFALGFYGFVIALRYNYGSNVAVLYGVVAAGAGSWGTPLVLPPGLAFLGGGRRLVAHPSGSAAGRRIRGGGRVAAAAHDRPAVPPGQDGARAAAGGTGSADRAAVGAVAAAGGRARGRDARPELDLRRQRVVRFPRCGGRAAHRATRGSPDPGRGRGSRRGRTGQPRDLRDSPGRPLAGNRGPALSRRAVRRGLRHRPPAGRAGLRAGPAAARVRAVAGAACPGHPHQGAALAGPAHGRGAGRPGAPADPAPGRRGGHCRRRAQAGGKGPARRGAGAACRARHEPARSGAAHPERPAGGHRAGGRGHPDVVEGPDRAA